MRGLEIGREVVGGEHDVARPRALPAPVTLRGLRQSRYVAGGSGDKVTVAWPRSPRAPRGAEGGARDAAPCARRRDAASRRPTWSWRPPIAAGRGVST
jgi:hypothetical protein